LEQRSGSEVLGDIIQGETVRKNISFHNGFQFHLSTSSSSSSTAVLIANNALLWGFEPGVDLIAQAVAQAQEQLC